MAANKYLLTAATLTGIALGSISTAALTARAGIAKPEVASYRGVFTRAQIAGATGLQMANYGCDQIDADLGLSGATACQLADVQNFCVYLNDAQSPGQAVLIVQAKIDGTWVAGEPE